MRQPAIVEQLVFGNRTISCSQLVKNQTAQRHHRRQGHIHYSNVAFNRIADENRGIAGHQWHFLFAE